MQNLRIACALLALIVALYSATLVVVVKINLAVALACITVVIALLTTLIGAVGRRETNERGSV